MALVLYFRSQRPPAVLSLCDPCPDSGLLQSGPTKARVSLDGDDPLKPGSPPKSKQPSKVAVKTQIDAVMALTVRRPSEGPRVTPRFDLAHDYRLEPDLMFFHVCAVGGFILQEGCG